MGVEVDLIIESNSSITVIEIKSATTAKEKMFKGLNRFAEISGKDPDKYVVYRGEFEQNFNLLGSAIPYQKFLGLVLPSL